MKSALSNRTSCFLVISAAALWGGIGVFFNILSSVGFSQMQVVAIRVSTAALALGIYILATNRALFRIRLKDCWCFVGTGIVSLAFFNWCYFTAIELTSLAVAAVLLYTSPIFVMLFSAILFQERFTPRKLLALLLTFIGCACMAGILGGTNGTLSMRGFAIGIGAGIGYALYSIFGRFALQKGYDSITISEYTFLFAALGSIPLSKIWTAAPLFLQPQTLLGALGIGLLCCVFPFILYTKGLAGIETSKAAILATMEPAVAAFLSFLLYHESLLGMKGIGICLVFASVLLLNESAKRKE